MAGLVVAQAAAGPESTPLPPRLTADVSDTLGLRTNPAGLGALVGSELRLLYGFQPGASDPAGDGVQSDLHSGGIYGGVKIADRLTLAAGYDFSERGTGASAERGLLGVGFDLGVVTWGFAWELRDDFGRGEEGFVRVGGQLRPFRWAALGVAVQDLAEAVGERSWDLGLALRPGLDWITLSSQWRLTESVPINDDTLDLRFLLSAEPVSGLLLGFGTDHDFDRLDFQLALDFGHGGTEGAVLVRNDEPLGAAQLVMRSRPVGTLGQPRRMIVVQLEGDLRPEPNIDLFRQRIELGAYGSVPLLLDAIARSDRARGALIRIGGLSVGWAKLEELRAGIESIRDRGKPVVCVVDTPGDAEYYLASACQRIVGYPSTALNVNGIAANLLYLGRGLSMLGVEVDAVRREEYKTAPNPFTRSSPSPEDEETAANILDQTHDSLVSGIAAGRNVDRSRVLKLIDAGTVTATEAVAQGWLDATLYPDEIDGWVERQIGGYEVGKPKDILPATRRQWGARPKIAIIPVDATIARGESRTVPFGFGGSSGATTISRALRKAAKDPTIRAIVLRVDSPGGEAVASDLMARAVSQAAEKKPVIVSMGDLATSGGYYISAPATAIFAEPTTITGSIGVFSLRFSLNRLLDKLGISAYEYERGRHANLRSPLQPLREEDRAVIDREVAFRYAQFLEVVAEGRDLPLDDVRELAGGRIWTGAQAKERRLVDEIGGFADAIRFARQSAGIPDFAEVELVLLPESRASLPDYISRWTPDGDAEVSDAERLADLIPDRLRRIAGMLAVLPEQSLVALPMTLVQVD